jgi:hypothetical protein
VRLHFGIEEVPYAEGQENTGDVAEILEAKFGVMQTFADQNQDDIAEMIANGLAGSLESIMAGAPPEFNVFGQAMSDIESRFVDYIDHEEHGIQTKAKESPKGGARKKRQYKKASSKITFVDSGLYRGNFKAWVSDDR